MAHGIPAILLINAPQGLFLEEMKRREKPVTGFDGINNNPF